MHRFNCMLCALFFSLHSCLSSQVFMHFSKIYATFIVLLHSLCSLDIFFCSHKAIKRHYYYYLTHTAADTKYSFSLSPTHTHKERVRKICKKAHLMQSQCGTSNEGLAYEDNNLYYDVHKHV